MRFTINSKMKILRQTKNWTAFENVVDIQILPTGEENLHELNRKCRCLPEVSNDLNGRSVVAHFAFDNREFDEIASQINEPK